MKMSGISVFVALFLVGNSMYAAAATSKASGPGALALAALVGQYSPTVSASQKLELARILDSNLQGITSTTAVVSVKVGSVACRMSDVAISQRSCALIFGTKTITVNGRRANELLGTLAEAGVQSDGAAGTIWFSITHLSCAISPALILQNDSAGADCTYQ
jgi:hypothetical protein